MPIRAAAADVVAEVASLAVARQFALVGIGGHGGAGKTALANHVAARVPSSTVVHLDDFARPDQGFDWERALDQLIVPLASEHEAHYQRWDWATNRGGEWHAVRASSVVIVEGVAAFAKAFGDIWALRVWIEAPFEVRLRRGLERDGEAARAQWVEVWEPEENAYIERERPDLSADLLLDGTAPMG